VALAELARLSANQPKLVYGFLKELHTKSSTDTTPQIAQQLKLVHHLSKLPLK